MDKLNLTGNHARAIVRRCAVGGEMFDCLGTQVAKVLELLVNELPECEWFGTKLRVNGRLPKVLSVCDGEVTAPVGTSAVLLEAVAEVEQFLSGRLIAVASDSTETNHEAKKQRVVAVVEFVHAERMDVSAETAGELGGIARAFSVKLEAQKGHAAVGTSGDSTSDDPIDNLRSVAGWLGPLLTVLGVVYLVAVVIQTGVRLAQGGPAALVYLVVGLPVGVAFAVAAIGLSLFVTATVKALEPKPEARAASDSEGKSDPGAPEDPGSQ